MISQKVGVKSGGVDGFLSKRAIETGLSLFSTFFGILTVANRQYRLIKTMFAQGVEPLLVYVKALLVCAEASLVCVRHKPMPLLSAFL